MLDQPTDILCKLQHMTNKRDKVRHQVKSKFYYMFWGAATISVFVGQLYVGSGYRQMSRSFNRILDAVRFEFVTPESYEYVPRAEIWDIDREESLYHPTNPPTKIY